MNQQDTNFYHPDEGADTSSPAAPAGFSWEAPEFIEHHHPASWYAALIVVTVILALLTLLLSRDYFATVIILIIGIIIWVFAGHKPATVKYELNHSELSINGKSYPYSAYKSFTILHEGEFSSINLMPLKRLMPPISAYYAPGDEEKIVDTIGAALPYEDRPMDSIDRLARRLRL
jgi:hypothetical protein